MCCPYNFHFFVHRLACSRPPYNKFKTRARLFATLLARNATCDVSVHPSCLHLGPLSPPLRGNGVHGRPGSVRPGCCPTGAGAAVCLCPLHSHRPPFKSRAVPPSVSSAPPHPRFQALLRRRSRLQGDPCRGSGRRRYGGGWGGGWSGARRTSPTSR